MNLFTKSTLWAAVMGALAAPAAAQDVYLVACEFNQTMPDGVTVPMWGYAQVDQTYSATPCAELPVTSPGPVIRVPPADTSLTIHLFNQLGAPTSLMIPGQAAPMSPVFFTDGQGRQRARSFTHETAAGATGQYSWTNLRPGTYAYHSATHPQVQVQMGLYGALARDAAAGEAYAGVPYDNEALLLYSEIDPDLHAAVASGQYGPGQPVTSTIDYTPRYFLVNGNADSANAAPVPAGVPGQRTLLRLVNMGLRTHTPVVENADLTVVAEDGNPYPFPRQQYSVMLAAGKTKDALFVPPAEGQFPLYDRMLDASRGSEGGMVSVLEAGTQQLAVSTGSIDFGEVAIGSVSSAAVTITNSGPSPSPAAISSVAASGAGYSASNDCPATLDPGASCEAQVAFAPTQDGLFSGALNIDYTVNGTPRTLSVALTGIALAAAQPSAVGDAYATDEDTVLDVAAPGVLGNDSDPNVPPEPLSAAVVDNPMHGSVSLGADGAFSYTPDADFHGTDSFTYQASNSSSSSLVTQVEITINSVNDLPVAVAESYAVTAGETLTVAAPGVLGNDSDVEASPLSAVLTSDASGGTLALAADGSFSYTPNAATTTDSFSYAASDGAGQGDPVTVSIDVLPAVNSAPVAVDDYASTRRGATINIPVLANDSDADGSLVPTSVTVTVPPSHSGTATVNADGSITYTPPPAFRGTEAFAYTVMDDQGAVSNEAVVRINAR